jgi:hypothetical protein
MVQNKAQIRSALRGGGASGLAAGALLTLFMTVMAAVHHKDLWYGIKGAGAPFVGPHALTPGFDATAVFIGLASHLAISAGWGMAFALLAHGLDKAATLAASAAWGVVVWLGMYYVALPMVGLASMRTDATAARAIAFHVIFGVLLGGSLLLYRHLVDRPAVPASWRRGPHTGGPITGRRTAA